MGITQSQHRREAISHLDAARQHIAAIQVDVDVYESEQELFEVFCDVLRSDYESMDEDEYVWPDTDARLIARFLMGDTPNPRKGG
jgi:hypothetical protein